MTRLLIAAILFGCAPSFAAVAHVASGTGRCSGVGTATGNITNPATSCTGSSSTGTFTETPTTTGDLIVIAVNCTATTTNPTASSLSASGWTFTQLYAVKGYNGWGSISLWWAYAPNTSASTITVSVTGGSGCTWDTYIDEFSGVAASSPIDNQSTANNTTGGCANSLTPVANNTGLYGLCYADSLTAVGSGFTKGADDTLGDWTEYKILAGGAGVSQSINWTSSGQFVSYGLSLAPATGTTPRTMPAAIY